MEAKWPGEVGTSSLGEEMTATYRRTIEPQRRPSERGGDKGTLEALRPPQV